MRCDNAVAKADHDLCYGCWQEQEAEDDSTPEEEKFADNLDLNEIHTTYIMFYGGSHKIGYTKDLNARIIEIKRKYPNNKFVYFREFVNESEARRFEAWLKCLSERALHKFVAGFQDKIRKVVLI